MYRPPPLSSAPSYPITLVTGMLAVIATTLWWAGKLQEHVFITQSPVWHSPWQPLTSTLLHVNILHLGFNLYWLWYFGTRFEQLRSKGVAAACFLVLAAFSVLAQFAAGYSGVGLSGVVYGLFTLFWLAGRYDPRFDGPVTAQVVVVFVAWFFICIVASASGLMSIGNVAHGAGAILGLSLAWAITARNRSLLTARWVLPVVATFVLAYVADPLHQQALKWAYGVDQSFYLASQYERGGEPGKAIDELHDAAQREPGNAKVWHALADAHARQEQWREAAAAYRKATELRPGQPEFWFRLGDCLARCDVQSDAERAFESWDKLADEDVTRRETIAHWYRYWAQSASNDGDAERAADLTDKAERLESDSSSMMPPPAEPVFMKQLSPAFAAIPALEV